MNEKIPVNEAALKLNMNTVTLQKRLDYFDCNSEEGLISKRFFEEILKQKFNTIEIGEIISELYYLLHNKRINNLYLKKVMVYARGFGYWGAKCIVHPIFQENHFNGEGIYVYKEDISIIQENVYEMIFLKHASKDEKINYLITKTKLKKFNNTVGYIIKFYKGSLEKNKGHVIEFVNYFRYFLEKELNRYTNAEITLFFKNASLELSSPARNELVRYYDYLKENEVCNSDIIVRYNKHLNELDKEVEPYDQQTYFSIAYMVLNEEYWKRHNMLQKAVEKENHAKVWLYHLMHFICSWRCHDIREKLPRFELEESSEDILYKIKNGNYSEQHFIKTAEFLFYTFKYNNDKFPSKTKKNPNVQPLRLVIPESIKPVFGMLALICEAHNRLNERKESLCSMRRPEKEDSKRLFGKPYMEVLKGKGFSNRRANKNFMNMIAEKSEEEGIDGYLLAAYARSHTGGLEKIPEVTSKYLKAKMDGHTADEIVKQLMERGVCSFVPYLMCSAIDQKGFKDLSVENQTSIIKEIGISPAGIENILKIDEKLMISSREKVKEIIKWVDTDNIDDIAKSIIESIINGDCWGKDEGVYCLSKACHKGCVQKQRESCIGCGNEMLTKSVLIALSQEIFKIEEAFANAKTHAERIKWKMILDKKLYPTSHEILYTLKYIYNVDISDYKRILEREDQYAVISKV